MMLPTWSKASSEADDFDSGFYDFDAKTLSKLSDIQLRTFIHESEPGSRRRREGEVEEAARQRVSERWKTLGFSLLSGTVSALLVTYIKGW